MATSASGTKRTDKKDDIRFERGADIFFNSIDHIVLLTSFLINHYARL